MEATLLTMGFVCIAAAIAGGGLKAFNIEIPALASERRQVGLGVFGVALLLTAWRVTIAARREAEYDRIRNMPVAPAPTAKPQKTFATKVELSENADTIVGAIHLGTKFIASDGTALFADIRARVIGHAEESGRLREGGSLSLALPGCTEVRVTVSEIRMDMAPGIDIEQVRRMGAGGEAFMTRSVSLTVATRCDAGVLDGS